jgi:4'-phosphopantetheinyl transferase
MTNSTVTVWTMQVGTPSAAALSRWYTVLDSREVAQAARFHADRDRHLYIAAHALTRALLAHMGQKTGRRLAICRNRKRQARDHR